MHLETVTYKVCQEAHIQTDGLLELKEQWIMKPTSRGTCYGARGPGWRIGRNKGLALCCSYKEPVCFRGVGPAAPAAMYCRDARCFCFLTRTGGVELAVDTDAWLNTYWTGRTGTVFTGHLHVLFCAAQIDRQTRASIHLTDWNWMSFWKRVMIWQTSRWLSSHSILSKASAFGIGWNSKAIFIIFTK